MMTYAKSLTFDDILENPHIKFTTAERRGKTFLLKINYAFSSTKNLEINKN